MALPLSVVAVNEPKPTWAPAPVYETETVNTAPVLIGRVGKNVIVRP